LPQPSNQGNFPVLHRGYFPRWSTHDLQGRRKSARREDGTTWQYDYNTRSEVTGAKKRQENSDLVPGLNFGYNYDGMGNRLSASKGTPALVTTYTPNAMNRYANITSPGGDDILVKSETPVDVEVDEDPVTVTSSGDFRGARITATNTNAPAFPEISITGDNNFSETGHRWIPQAEFSPQYDEDGNLTNDERWIYTWDAMNRLVGMTPTAAALTAGVPNQSLSFAYDHLGRRIAKKVTKTSGETITVKDFRYLYEGWNVVAQFTADSSNTLTPDATFLWSLDLSDSFHGAGGVGGLHSVNLYSGGATGTLCLACYDANGNIIAWTDTTGRILQRQDYDPFGNRVIRERLAITPEVSDRLEYGFSTKPLDVETGLIYYIHRYYGPRHGQWLSHDPIEEAGGLNLYGFVGNNGIERSDSLGLDGPFWDSIEAERRRRKDAPYGKLWVEATLRSEPAYASATGKLFGLPPALEKLIGVFGDGETVAISALPQGGGAYARLTGLVLDPTSSTDGDVLAHELVHAFNHRRKTGVPFAGYNDEGMASAMQNYLKSFQGPDGFAELEKLLNSMESRQFPGREEIEGIARKWAGGFEPYRIGRDLPVKGVNGKSFPLSEVDFRLLESHFGVRYTCEELASLYNNKPGVENGCIKFTCASLRSEGFPIRIDPDGIIWFGMNGPLRPYWIRR
jgi:RHS repeat-associated protein